MTRLSISAVAIFLAMGFSSLCNAQDPNSILGIGASFGSAVPKTDVPASPANPYGRLFLRYYTSPKFAFDVGVGLGTLKAESGDQYFSTPIYPIDFRLMFLPVKIRSVEPYLYAGAGL
jgi:hypothetical protein